MRKPLVRNHLSVVTHFSSFLSTCAAKDLGFSRLSRPRRLTKKAKSGVAVHQWLLPLARAVPTSLSPLGEGQGEGDSPVRLCLNEGQGEGCLTTKLRKNKSPAAAQPGNDRGVASEPHQNRSSVHDRVNRHTTDCMSMYPDLLHIVVTPRVDPRCLPLALAQAPARDNDRNSQNGFTPRPVSPY